MIVIIAGSPVVGQRIARIVGADEKHSGYLEGNGYVITWLSGPLVELAAPEKYGFRRHSELPFIPEPFQLAKRHKWMDNRHITDRIAARQLKIITELLESSTSVIAATDADPDGELAFRYIYEYVGCRLPVKRLWLTSLTDDAIYEGLHKLRDGSRYDNLFHAAVCRDRADWLIGVNVGAALSRVTGTPVRISDRSQVAALAMICSRYLENRNFTPSSYRRLHATVIKNGAACTFGHGRDLRNKQSADAAHRHAVRRGTAVVTAMDTKCLHESPPLLYDLIALQQDCLTRLGMTAAQTLKTARALYEKALISYPCTDARHITSILPSARRKRETSEKRKLKPNLKSAPRASRQNKYPDCHDFRLFVNGADVNRRHFLYGIREVGTPYRSGFIGKCSYAPGSGCKVVALTGFTEK